MYEDFIVYCYATHIRVQSYFYFYKMFQHLSTFKKAEIIVLHEQNIPITEIARRLMISRRSVQLWVHRYAETGDVEHRRRGPKPKANSSARHYDIVVRHKADPFLPTHTTVTALNVSIQTVRRHLHSAGLRCRKPAKKILLSVVHQQKRLEFARDFINFDWANSVVIFSDEKTFKSDKDGHKILGTKDGERYTNCNLLPCRTSGRITVGYWGWMSFMGPGELVEISGLSNSHDYLNILQNVM